MQSIISQSFVERCLCSVGNLTRAANFNFSRFFYVFIKKFSRFLFGSDRKKREQWTFPSPKHYWWVSIKAEAIIRKKNLWDRFSSGFKLKVLHVEWEFIYKKFRFSKHDRCLWNRSVLCFKRRWLCDGQANGRKFENIEFH